LSHSTDDYFKPKNIFNPKLSLKILAKTQPIKIKNKITFT